MAKRHFLTKQEVFQATYYISNIGLKQSFKLEYVSHVSKGQHKKKGMPLRENARFLGDAMS